MSEAPAAMPIPRKKWWASMSLENQARFMAALDPANNPDSPWPVRKFNQEAQQFRKRAGVNERCVRALKKVCYCDACLHRAKDERLFPAYYLPRLISFECYWEGWDEHVEEVYRDDPELALELVRLANEPARDQGMIVPRHWSYGRGEDGKE